MRFTYCALELTHREKRLDKLVDGACQRLVIAPPAGIQRVWKRTLFLILGL